MKSDEELKAYWLGVAMVMYSYKAILNIPDDISMAIPEVLKEAHRRTGNPVDISPSMEQDLKDSKGNFAEEFRKASLKLHEIFSEAIKDIKSETPKDNKDIALTGITSFNPDGSTTPLTMEDLEKLSPELAKALKPLVNLAGNSESGDKTPEPEGYLGTKH